MLGIRGMPGVEGGVETHAEQLYPRLSELGCDVEALVRAPYVSKATTRFGPVRLRRLWSPTSPGLEALLHSLLGVLYAGVVRPDVLHIHAVGPALVTPIARLLGLKVVVTHHGADYDRDKWGPFARRVLRLGERCGVLYSHGRIAISPVIGELIRTKYDRSSTLIPNGVVVPEVPTEADHVLRLGLQPGQYFVQVGRMVPEKRQLDLIEAYRRASPRGWKLAIVGQLPDNPYGRSVAAAAGSAGVVLTGFLQGTALQQVYSHAGAFVLPSSHEGLPIALLEALSYGLPVLASDIAANLAVGLDASSYVPLGDVSALADRLTQLSGQASDTHAREERRQWVAARFDWDRVARQTHAAYVQVAKTRS